MLKIHNILVNNSTTEGCDLNIMSMDFSNHKMLQGFWLVSANEEKTLTAIKFRSHVNEFSIQM